MGYAGQILAKHMGGLSWPVTYVGLIVIYVAIHYMFVSQSSQVLGPLGSLSRRRHPRRCSRAADGIRAALREQLLLRDHAAGRKPERHLRRQRLSHATRALPARAADDPLLYGGVSGDRNCLDIAGNKVNSGTDSATSGCFASCSRLPDRSSCHRQDSAAPTREVPSGPGFIGGIASPFPKAHNSHIGTSSQVQCTVHVQGSTSVRHLASSGQAPEARSVLVCSFSSVSAPLPMVRSEKAFS